MNKFLRLSYDFLTMSDNLYTLETLPKVSDNTTHVERRSISGFDDESFMPSNRFMSCSDLISHLVRLQKDHGDLPIFINSENIGFIVGFNAFEGVRTVVPPSDRKTGDKKYELKAVMLEINTNWTYIV